MALPLAMVVGKMAAKKVAGSALKKAAGSAVKAAGKGLRRGAKSGKKMAKNMMKNVKEIRKQMKARKGKGGDGGSGESTSSKLGPSSSGGSTGNPVIDNALNNIDNAILGMLKGEQQSIKDARLQDTKRQRRTREGVLESGSKFISGLASKVPKGMKKTFDSMGKFIKNVVIGSILLYILKQWDSIVAAYKKAVETLKKLWEALEPWAKGTWDFLKWISRFVLDWSARLLGVEEPDTKTVKQNLEEMGEKLKPVKEGFDGLMKKINALWKLVGGKGEFKVDAESAGKAVTERGPEAAKKTGEFFTNVASGSKKIVEDVSEVGGNVVEKFKEGRDAETTQDGKVSVTVPESARKGVTLDPKWTGGEESGSNQSNAVVPSSIKKGTPKKRQMGRGAAKARQLSQGLDTHASYEKGGGTTNIIMSKQEAPSSGGGGEGVVKILPIPIVNNTKEVANNLYNYELFKV